MKTQKVVRTDLEITRLAYGCMEIGGSWDTTPITPVTRKEGLAIIHTALDQGINFFDHADLYCHGKSEEVFSGIWEERPSLRQKIFLQSKCGIRFAGVPQKSSPQRFDFSYEHIIWSVEGILKRLKTDHLDSLLLHRADPLVEPEEVAKAFDELHAAGKVRYFGVSNHTGAQIDLLLRFVKQPLVFNQLELSVVHTQLLDEGIVVNQELPDRHVRVFGTIEYCRLHDITIQAWSPLAKGGLTGAAKKNQPKHWADAARVLTEMAAEKGVSRETILIAWILRHPAHIQPVVGTTNPGRLIDCCAADKLDLTREEWYRLFVAGRGDKLP